MEAAVTFVRLGDDRTPSVFVPISKPKGRPRSEFRVRIRSEADVGLARRSNVPLFLLDARTVASLGYPIEFPSELVAARWLVPALDTNFRVIPFLSDTAALHPRFEDVAVAMLSVDAIGARAILDRNRDAIDPVYLLRRVVQEQVEEKATWVRFFDLVPELPRVGRPIPKAALDRKLRNNPIRETFG